MITGILVSAVAFAAFFIWLVVRVVNRREPWAKRTLAAILIALAVAALIVWFSLGLIGDLIWKYKLFPIG